MVFPLESHLKHINLSCKFSLNFPILSHSMTQKKWHFWIDRGGTFTDIVARHPDGHLITHKLLSENKEFYKNSALQGIRDVLGISKKTQLSDNIAEVRMGTTLCTNALLERKGERVVLLITQGFKDALRIGYQNRPKIFARKIVLPEQLYEQVYEIEERIDAHGQIITVLNREKTRQLLQKIYEQGYRSIAIVFMHAYRYPEHENAVAEIARTIGFTQISTSQQVSPLVKLVSRGDTTVVDAYLSPGLRNYINNIIKELGSGTRLFFMQSNGGLSEAKFFQGKNAILSGPAGGVVGAVKTCEQAGFKKIIGFDMGGTSTDVCHFDGTFERTFETQVAGVRVRTPMLLIHTVAAGGGSICHFDGMRYRVGPESAGANPGPCCYRHDGPLAITDCNVLLGKIQARFFPHVFGKSGDQPLDCDAVVEKFKALSQEIHKATGKSTSISAIAEGFLQIAVNNMAKAIKHISTQRGYDITDYVLSCFGGAAGQCACQVADALGMKTIVIHPFAGVLSAYGMGLADIRVIREQTVEMRLKPKLIPQLDEIIDKLRQSAKKRIEEQVSSTPEITEILLVHLRYKGTNVSLPVQYDKPETMIAAFEHAHQRRYGFLMGEDYQIFVEAVSVESIVRAGGELRITNDELRIGDQGSGIGNRESGIGDQESKIEYTRFYSRGQYHKAPIYERKKLACGDVVKGPAIIVEKTGTNVIEPDWQAEVNSFNQLILKRMIPLPRTVAIGTNVDPVMLEIFNNLFMSIAEQMGVVLENTSYSVNIKERLDFSCAIFNAKGHLIANAPHIPVHLGSMGESVRAIMRSQKLRKGDVFLLNSPYDGGTHLPDLTVVTPVFHDSTKKILFYVASRAHHADIGGITPGSIPPNSTSIEEEGILIPPFKLVSKGQFQEAKLLKLLENNTWPARNAKQNIADLNAQIAANEKGAHELRAMVARYGLNVVDAYMQYVQDNAEESVRRAIDQLKDGQFNYAMDDGTKIKVSVKVNHKKRNVIVDFKGTSPQHAGNFNAPKAVCIAAVLYVFRSLVDQDIPLNEGCLKPLEILIPKHCLLNPRSPAAVVAGNVETSQYITDTLYGALGVMAGSYGTMSNFTFGNKCYQYYETICGGAGAGHGFHGTSAVHVNMTNSRLTDPEVLEWRYPVLLENFYIRQGSGGTGRWHGGDGTTRRIRFLEPMTAAILSTHRIIPPYGLQGGLCGETGKNTVERVNGVIENVGGVATVEMNAGDVFIIETPGGGGYGKLSNNQ